MRTFPWNLMPLTSSILQTEVVFLQYIEERTLRSDLQIYEPAVNSQHTAPSKQKVKLQ